MGARHAPPDSKLHFRFPIPYKIFSPNQFFSGLHVCGGGAFIPHWVQTGCTSQPVTKPVKSSHSSLKLRKTFFKINISSVHRKTQPDLFSEPKKPTIVIKNKTQNAFIRKNCRVLHSLHDSAPRPVSFLPVNCTAYLLSD